MIHYNTEAIYTIEDAKNAIETEIKECRRTLAAWQRIARATKKNGGDFANRERNFIVTPAARVGDYVYIRFEYGVTNRLKVYFDSPFSGYTYDTIYIENDNSVDEIFYRIEKRIAFYNETIAAKERGMKAAEKRLKEADKHMNALRGILEEAKKDDTNYILRDYIENGLHR